MKMYEAVNAFVCSFKAKLTILEKENHIFGGKKPLPLDALSLREGKFFSYVYKKFLLTFPKVQIS